MGIGDFAGRLKNFFRPRTAVSEELFEDLADLLVEGDFGAAESYLMAEKLRDYARKEKIGDAGELRQVLALFLEEILEAAGRPAALEDRKDGPDIILLLGVNGVGKTTTAAKLACRFRDAAGRRPILAAADTFRAAAIPQLKIHGDRLGVRVVAHRQGGDPAAVVYDAIEAARAGGGDLIIADTAGRMHTKAALVEELKKIDRVVESKTGVNAGARDHGAPPAPPPRYLKYLVLDATTGRNALSQAEIFHDALALDGAILTKYDSGAKGGVVFSLASALKIPVIYLCEGEKYSDIRVFTPHDFAREFTGIE
ncbi:MAG: signal recognition particle-docking protein FtsY [Treponema sp.]|jgi:fused signal recognition particle receptor|nr:signal recognition particle-docking protein FtsY [Treponema sp.]